jgi:DNA polymerase-3 subunit epsilon
MKRKQKSENLAFLDVETTGGSAYYERIIEIGVLRVENGQLVKVFSTLLDPETTISPWITTITGITQKDVDGKPTFHQIADELLETLKDCTFVAHNVRFDYGFVKAEFARCGIDYSSPQFCTVKLSRALYPKQKKHNLDSIIKRHKIECENRHRALDDARVLWEFYQKIGKRFSAKKLAEAIEGISTRVAWPANIPRADIEAIPDLPGVYIFYGENNTPLYVGKSVNLRSRILSHFNDDLRSSKEMQLSTQVKRIDTILTAGELGALIKESALVKELMPLYNRQLRRSQYLTLVKTYLDDDGYIRVKLENTDESEIQPEEIANIAGIFRSRRQAENELERIALEHRLCKKLLGLEKTKKACFGQQLKRCDGACIGEEKPNMYNLRFELAFSKMRFKKWPYEQPIVVSETLGQVTDHHVIDKWCYLGKAEQGENQIQREVKFDLDIYKILKSFLMKPEAQRLVHGWEGSGT